MVRLAEQLPKFHYRKGDWVIVDYKRLPRILKRNGNEGRPHRTGRENRLRRLSKRRDCKVFHKMLPVCLTILFLSDLMGV